MAVASALQRVGIDVFVPLFAAHSRVDMVAATNDGLQRVQCKTARVFGGSIYFRTSSNTHNVPMDYRDQVDAFGVYAPDLSLVYLLPVSGLPVRGATLRLEPTRNGQQAGIRWAADYLVGPP
jgi:hypothetical protein